jgi:hypothetical protein
MSIKGQAVTSQWGPVIPKQSIYKYSTVQNHRIGDCLVLGERRFHYAKNGTTALLPGKFNQGAVITAADNYLVPVATAAAVGDKSINITPDATVAANAFCGGYLHMETTDSLGNYYKIKNHGAMTSGTATRVYLYDPLVEALTTSATITMTQSPWNNVVVVPNGGITAMMCGVSPIDIPASTASVFYYFWMQTWGPCPVLVQGNVVIGQDVIGLGGTADGATGPVAADAATFAGICMRDSAAYCLVFLHVA